MSDYISEKSKKRIENAIEKIKSETGIPYIDVICAQGHKEIFRYFTGEGVTGKELLYMYSCTKPITVVAAMRLVEEGKLSLSDNVGKYLPEINSAYVICKNGEKVSAGDKITVSHLLTMSAGFNYEAFSKEPVLNLARESKGKARLCDFIAEFVKEPLDFFPGERFEYSICHDILAAVIEIASGKSFSEYVNEVIFLPLSMKNSRLDNKETGVADIYLASFDGKIEKVNEAKGHHPTKCYESGGAGLVSTVEDYSLFIRMLASSGVSRDGCRILSPETLKRIYTPRIETETNDNGFTCIQGDEYDYGLGVRVRKKATEWGLPIGEFGWDGLAGSYLMVDPVRQISVFIGMHVRGWPHVFKGRHLEIVESIYRELFNM